MTAPKGLDRWGEFYYKWCRVFVIGLECILAISAVLGAVDLAGAAVYGSLRLSNPVDLTALTCGFLILLFAGIFRSACVLQQDADETI